MAAADPRDARRPDPDPVLLRLADYVTAGPAPTALAMETARHDLMDTLACGLLALRYPACTRLLGPVVPGAAPAEGVPVPGTEYRLDPVTAAWNMGLMNRWLDFNDTWLAAEWGHPSDNLAAILALADHQSRAVGGPAPVMRDVLTALVRAHEIQGVLALENAFNRRGLDHVLLVRVASACVTAGMLGLGRDGVINAASHAWLDGGALRAYRHAPQAGPRKSWAAGDAAARGLWLALLVARGEPGYPAALSAPQWGFEAALLGGKPVTLGRELGSYVMENVLFKIAYPAEFHAQTAVEAAVTLHPAVTPRLERIERIVIETQEAGARIIDKTGPLANPADRDHCLQYMVAVALLNGDLTAGDYQDAVATDPRIDTLRQTMVVREDRGFSRDYLDPDKRAIANAVQVFFDDGSATDRVRVDYPLGHRRRRAEGLPRLRAKFEHALDDTFPPATGMRIRAAFDDPDALAALPVHAFMDLWQG